MHDAYQPHLDENDEPLGADDDGGAQAWQDDLDDSPLMDGMGEELRQFYGE